MGRLRIYSDNATRQRAWQKKQKEKQFKEQFNKNANAYPTKPIENFGEILLRNFPNNTEQQVREAYSLTENCTWKKKVLTSHLRKYIIT